MLTNSRKTTKRLFLISLYLIFISSFTVLAEELRESALIKSEEIISDIIKKTKEDLKINSSTKLFWERVKKRGTPLIEKINASEYIVTFLYKGAKKSVFLIGGPSAEFLSLNKLEKSDIWYKSFKVKKGIRLSYKLSADSPKVKGSKRDQRVSTYWHSKKDIFNKMPYMDRSSFNIKNDNFIDWTRNLNSKKGSVQDYEIKSKILKNTRTISIYTPYKFNVNKEHDLLFVFDAKDYQSKVPTPRILDNLIEKNKIKPTVAIFISNISAKSRKVELPPNKNFADFIAQEVLPFIKTKINVKHKKESTILTGSSYGGLASAYVAYEYPNIFGKVLSQSGSFWWDLKNKEKSQWLTKEFEKSENKKIVFYLNAGIYETKHLRIDILKSNKYLYEVLKNKHYDVKYEVFQTNHDYFAWKYSLAYGLIHLNSVK